MYRMVTSSADRLPPSLPSSTFFFFVFFCPEGTSSLFSYHFCERARLLIRTPSPPVTGSPAKINNATATTFRQHCFYRLDPLPPVLHFACQCRASESKTSRYWANAVNNHDADHQYVRYRSLGWHPLVA